MFMSKFLIALAALTVSFGAHAVPTFYTSQGAFVTAASPSQFESFEGSPDTGSTSTNMIFGPMSVSCTGSVYCPGFFGQRTIGTATHGTVSVFFATPDTMTFTFSSALTSFGIDVIDLGTAGATSLTMTTTNGSSTLYTGHVGGFANLLFAGVIDSNPFTSITFSATARDDGIDFDSARFGYAATVPEPETYAMMLAGLGLLGFAARRRKQKTA